MARKQPPAPSTKEPVNRDAAIARGSDLLPNHSWQMDASVFALNFMATPPESKSTT